MKEAFCRTSCIPHRVYFVRRNDVPDQLHAISSLEECKYDGETVIVLCRLISFDNAKVVLCAQGWSVAKKRFNI
jgi:hypothetical protein